MKASRLEGTPGSEGEAALLDRLRSGDEQAFEEFVRSYAGPVRAVVQRFFRNPADADDVVQEVFLSALKGLDRFEGRSQLSTWLHRIAVNASLLRLRSSEQRHDAAVEAELEELLPAFGRRGGIAAVQERWVDTPEDPLEKAEIVDLVRRRVDELPDNYRIPLVLRDIEGWSHEDVARELGLTVNAAKVRVHRARQALRSLLEPRLKEVRA